MIKINNNFNNNQNFTNNVKQFELNEAKARMGNYQAQAQLGGTQQLRNQEFKQIQNYQSGLQNGQGQNGQSNFVNMQRLNEQLLIADKLNNGVNNAQNARLYNNLNLSDPNQNKFNTLF